ncbi:hypothetical protein ACHAPK_010980 [Fusarium culmorum]
MSDLPSEGDSTEKPLDASTQGPPPAKKRRVKSTKPRTTEYLNLLESDKEQTEDDTRKLNKLLATLREKKKIVVIAGAGISVAAGIPDFRSSTGLFARVESKHSQKTSGEHLFDASVYNHDESTEAFHALIKELAAKRKIARPTPFHHLLASLAKDGRLLRLYSQNIDCIDTSMEHLATQVPLNCKSPWPITIQLHGSLRKMVCTKCSTVEELDDEIFTGPKPPLCPVCQVEEERRTTREGK